MKMSSELKWLPELIEHISNWNEYLLVMHEKYLAEYKNRDNQLTYNGKAVIARRQPLCDEIEDSFWHIIGGANHVPDYERCERLLWAGAIIKNCSDPAIRIWRENNYRGAKRNSVIMWLYNYDYVVVLEERRRYYLLVTAYVVHEYKRHDLTRRYASSIKTGTAS